MGDGPLQEVSLSPAPVLLGFAGALVVYNRGGDAKPGGSCGLQEPRYGVLLSLGFREAVWVCSQGTRPRSCTCHGATSSRDSPREPRFP